MVLLAMQQTMPTSTSCNNSGPVNAVRTYVSLRQPAVSRARSQRGSCRAYRDPNCGPRYGPQWGFLNQMYDGQSAAQLEEIIKEFARQFGNSSSRNTAASPGAPAGYLAIDLEEQASQYTLTADVPGLQKTDLKISINQTERTLKIVGERQRNSEQPADEQESRPQFRKQLERSMGKFSRTIVLDKEADLSAVSARVDKGVLTITIQKLDLSKEEDEIRVTID